MSANIYYQPKMGKLLNNIGSPSKFLDLLRKLKGGQGTRFIFYQDDAQELRIAIKFVDDSGIRMALNELADACDDNEYIEVWAEY